MCTLLQLIPILITLVLTPKSAIDRRQQTIKTTNNKNKMNKSLRGAGYTWMTNRWSLDKPMASLPANLPVHDSPVDDLQHNDSLCTVRQELRQSTRQKQH